MKKQLSQVLASYLGYDYYNIDTIRIDENLVKTLTYEWISKYKIIPLTFDESNQRYILATSNLLILMQSILRMLYLVLIRKLSCVLILNW
ncbi:MAG: hypothetical protein ACLU5J_09415 [Christensenellales bacterium]